MATKRRFFSEEEQLDLSLQQRVSRDAIRAPFPLAIRTNAQLRREFGWKEGEEKNFGESEVYTEGELRASMEKDDEREKWKKENRKKETEIME